jgi:hypothetical protein
VTQENFEEFKKNFTAGLTFPIAEIPITASTQWSEFHTKRTSYLEKHTYDFNQNINRSISLSYTSDKAIEAWSNCMQEHQKETLLLRPTFAEDNVIIVQARWIPGAASEPGRRNGAPIVTGGHKDGSIPSTFHGGWTTMRFIRTGPARRC